MKTSEVEMFGPELDRARRWVDQQLAEYASFGSQCPETLQAAIRYSLLSPGKRLRPILVLAACRLCDGDLENALPAACAVEMVHTYSLIHDDLPAMDDDDFRRGQLSCHVAFDEATAILAGDALIPLAFEVLAADVRPAAVAIRCVRELAIAAGATYLVGGQADDLRMQNQEIPLSQLEQIHRRKTEAMLTVALRLGGICAQATEIQLQALTNYGQNLGLAFQITDDLLDLMGDQAKIGKRIGKDHELGKRTYPGLIGADASQQMALELADRAKEALAPWGDAANELRRFADFVTSRNH